MLHPRIAQKLGIPEGELHHIKNIIFDLGGVIVEIHYKETIEAFKNIGFQDFENIYSLIKHNRLFDMLETGKIPAQAFRNELRKFRNHLTDEQIDNAWNTMIGNMPSTHLPLLRSVKKEYKTYLLSNTNAIHIDYFIRYLDKKFGYNALADMFDKAYFSHEIGERKPDRQAYETVINDAGLIPNETLFIDDLRINIEGARNVGLLAYHLENESITDLFINEKTKG
jgi:putative hydrolase of the HAD superfamily